MLYYLIRMKVFEVVMFGFWDFCCIVLIRRVRVFGLGFCWRIVERYFCIVR